LSWPQQEQQEQPGLPVRQEPLELLEQGHQLPKALREAQV
jgi:hypothetical protein